MLRVALCMCCCWYKLDVLVITIFVSETLVGVVGHLSLVLLRTAPLFSLLLMHLSLLLMHSPAPPPTILLFPPLFLTHILSHHQRVGLLGHSSHITITVQDQLGECVAYLCGNVWVGDVGGWVDDRGAPMWFWCR